MILDSHFRGMTILSDVDPAVHSVEYVVLRINAIRATKQGNKLHCHLRLGQPSLWVLATSRQRQKLHVDPR
jgi:hypothetical protein